MKITNLTLEEATFEQLIQELLTREYPFIIITKGNYKEQYQYISEEHENVHSLEASRLSIDNIYHTLQQAAQIVKTSMDNA